MVGRIQKLNKNNSLFLLGARGCGKSTLPAELFGKSKDPLKTIWIDLLRAEDEDRFRRDPDQLSFLIEKQRPKRVIALSESANERLPSFISSILG